MRCVLCLCVSCAVDGFYVTQLAGLNTQDPERCHKKDESWLVSVLKCTDWHNLMFLVSITIYPHYSKARHRCGSWLWWVFMKPAAFPVTLIHLSHISEIPQGAHGQLITSLSGLDGEVNIQRYTITNNSFLWRNVVVERFCLWLGSCWFCADSSEHYMLLIERLHEVSQSNDVNFTSHEGPPTAQKDVYVFRRSR